MGDFRHDDASQLPQGPGGAFGGLVEPLGQDFEQSGYGFLTVDFQEPHGAGHLLERMEGFKHSCGTLRATWFHTPLMRS